MLVALNLALALGGAALHGAAAEGRPYEDLICSYPWDCQKAYRIMLCESTANPRALAGGNYGLMQINAIHSAMVGGDLNALYDPETNVRIAYALYSASGWQPWVACGG